MKKLLSAALLIFSATYAQAETASSVYSDLDITKCKTIAEYTEDVGGIEVLCKGIKGYDVTYVEGDLRGAISFGKNGKKQCASMQTFGAFNSVGKKIEWRMVKGKPIATILRWFTDNGEKDGKQNWLVVTKLGEKESCRTAIIDTKMPNANAVAQQKADAAASFNCEKDTAVAVGNAKITSAADAMSVTPCGPGPFGE